MAVLGPYALLAPISSGGMATVYLARAPHLPEPYRTVAVKVMRAQAAGFDAVAQEFLEEAKLTARIQHPNVVKVLDAGQAPEGLFLVMEYVSGDTLAGLCAASRTGALPLPPAVGLRVLAEALDGLHAAHQLRDEGGNLLGLVHRDFTPHNILVGDDGHVLLTDFGIAKAGNRVSLTRAGLIKGKVSYMSPEQVQGREMDRRCDVWAAGVIAWEVLAGRALYDSDDELRTMFQIATESPPRLASVQSGIASPLDAAVARALSRDPKDRWETARAFRDALEQAFSVQGELASTQELAAHLKALPKRAAVDEHAAEVTAVEERPRSRRPRWALPVAALLVLGAGAWFALLHRTTPVVALAPVPGRVAPLAVTPSPPPLPRVPTAVPTSAAKLGTLELYANARITRVRLNGRSVVPPRPLAHLKITLQPAELRGHTRLEAFSEDGRVSRLNLAPGASVAQLQFPALRAPPAPAPPLPARPEEPKKAPSLADNPYEKR